MFDWKKPTAQMLGRFQPWHSGHRELFKKAHNETGQVAIMIRDVSGIIGTDAGAGRTKAQMDNPFDFYDLQTKIAADLFAHGNFIEDEEMIKIKGCKTLVLNALRKEKHISHFTLDEAVELSQEVGAESVYLTHISHNMGKHHIVNGDLPQHIKLAYDGLSIDF